MLTVKSYLDLVTSPEARLSGFSWQANQKLARSNTFFKNAEYFRANCLSIKSIECIRRDKTLTEYIIAACMLSKKSLCHLPLHIQNNIIVNLIDFSKMGDPFYIQELERRYFLTCGDSLGGTMRNIVGQYAQQHLTKSICEILSYLGQEFRVLNNKAGKITQIVWNDRRVFFDQKPKFINKSIDIIVVKGISAINGLLENPNDYICCGELKGGIDPAGADEHWKTAKTALERIKTAFALNGLRAPNLIFLGAAIEISMAQEIFQLLENNWLTGAANLYNSEQLNEVIGIIIN